MLLLRRRFSKEKLSSRVTNGKIYLFRQRTWFQRYSYQRRKDQRQKNVSIMIGSQLMLIYSLHPVCRSQLSTDWNPTASHHCLGRLCNMSLHIDANLMRLMSKNSENYSSKLTMRTTDMSLTRILKSSSLIISRTTSSSETSLKPWTLTGMVKFIIMSSFPQ